MHIPTVLHGICARGVTIALKTTARIRYHFGILSPARESTSISGALRSGNPNGENSERRCQTGQGRWCQDRRCPLHRPARGLAALLVPRPGAPRGPVQGGARVRRLEHPRLPADPGERHASVPRSRDGDRGPDARRADPRVDLQRQGPGHPRGLHRATRGYIAQKAEEYLKSTGIADISYWGPEAEFFVFDSVRFDQNARCGYYFIDSNEAIWNSGREETPGNLGYKLRHKEGYFPCPPADSLQDLRSKMILKLMEVGVPIEVHHHEVGTAGQCEIDMRFGPLVQAWPTTCCGTSTSSRTSPGSAGKTVTFMPKPIFGDNGSGMHCHQSLWKGGKPLFYDEKGYGRPQRDGPVLHRRPAEARPRPAGHHQPDHQLVPPAGARLRGAGQPGLLPAQPLGGRPHSGLLEEPEVQADRVPLPRPELQPLPGLRRHAHGRPRRHPEQDRPGRAASTRTSTTSSPKRRPEITRRPARWARCSTPSKRITPGCSRAMSSPPT